MKKISQSDMEKAWVSGERYKFFVEQLTGDNKFKPSSRGILNLLAKRFKKENKTLIIEENIYKQIIYELFGNSKDKVAASTIMDYLYRDYNEILLIVYGKKLANLHKDWVYDYTKHEDILEYTFLAKGHADDIMSKYRYVLNMVDNENSYFITNMNQEFIDNSIKYFNTDKDGIKSDLLEKVTEKIFLNDKDYISKYSDGKVTKYTKFYDGVVYDCLDGLFDATLSKSGIYVKSTYVKVGDKHIMEIMDSKVLDKGKTVYNDMFYRFVSNDVETSKDIYLSLLNKYNMSYVVTKRTVPSFINFIKEQVESNK